MKTKTEFDLYFSPKQNLKLKSELFVKTKSNFVIWVLCAQLDQKQGGRPGSVI